VTGVQTCALPICIAQARAARERALLAAERLAVRRETALAWYAAYYAQQRLALFADLERENRLLRDTLGARVASGKAMPADATMARQETLMLADRRDEFERELARSRAALAGWVGSLEPGTAAASEAPVWPVDAARLRQGLHHHVELAAFGPMVAMADGELKEAEAARRGDWSWEVSYGKRGPGYGDMVSFQVSMDLPLWGERRQEPEIESRRRDIARIEAERDEMLRKHAEELEAMLAELRMLERAAARLADEGLALARERVALTLAAYESGRGDLAAVLVARREAVEARLRAVDLESQAQAARVRLTTLLAD
jgi:outer membrane protein TolC